MKVIEVFFSPHHTIEAIINLHNGHALSKAQLLQSMHVYNTLNSGRVPRLGDKVKIPVFDETDAIIHT